LISKNSAIARSCQVWRWRLQILWGAIMNELIFEESVDAQTPLNPTHLEAHIQCRLSGRIKDLHVVVQDHGLILRGQTATYYAKQLAQHAVMQATELPILANEIEVS
jgi:hypothetical protein